jgi:uncharacterized protein YfaS (alpha-2-macroglobulin family)
MRLLLVTLFFSSKLFAQNFWVESMSPKGQNVNPSISKIEIKFNENITSTVQASLTAEHKSKIHLSPAPDCNWVYSDFKTATCYLKNALLPNSNYGLSISPGFKGVTQKLPYGRSESFKTSGLQIVKYKTVWNKLLTTSTIEFNLDVDHKNLEATISCSEIEIKTKIKFINTKSIEVSSASDLPENQACFLKFKNEFHYTKFKGSVVLNQKILIHPKIDAVFANDGRTLTNYCSSNYYTKSQSDSNSIPQLKCEYRDQVILEIQPPDNKTIDFKKYIQVIPDDGIEIKKNDYNISVSGFKKPKQIYLIRVNKDFPMAGEMLNGDYLIQLETLEGPYILGIKKTKGVIERIGPIQIPYSIQNIKGLTLHYDFLTNADELKNLGSGKKNDINFTQTFSWEMKSDKNQSTLFPLDIKPLIEKAKIKSGLLMGKIVASDIEKDYIESNMVLRDEYSKDKNDREYGFNYLITDLGLHVKKALKGTLIWTFSLNSGEVLKGTKVDIVVTKGPEQKVYTKTTDESGMASFDDLILESKDNVFIYAKNGDDVSYLNTYDSSWSQGISNWDFNFQTNYYGQRNPIIADIVSERPLYLPGEEVRLKLYIRKNIPDSIELEPVGKQVHLKISDNRGSEVIKETIELNKYGTASVDFKLAKNAATGRYTVEIAIDRNKFIVESFNVEEFRKPEFKVSLKEDMDNYNGIASYFKGGGVQDIEGKMVFYFQKQSFEAKDPRFLGFQYPKSMSVSYYDYFDGDYESANGNLEFLHEENVTTNEEGKFLINKQNVNLDLKNYGRLLVETNFQDSNGGNISGRIESKFSPLKIFAGIKFDEWYYSTKKKFGPKVVVLNNEGKIQTGVKLELDIKRIDWIYERRLGSGNYFYYDSRKEEKDISSCEFTSNDNLSSCDVSLKDSGYYEFLVNFKDGSSDQVKTGVYVYEDGGYIGFSANNNDRINLNIENKELKLGDTLKVMAISPLKDATALITLERDGILYKEKINFKGNVILWDKKIDDEKFIPGFYVSIVIIKGRTSDKIDGEIDLGKPAFKIGYAKVFVENLAKRLNTKVKMSQATINPGKEIEGEVQLTDFKGKTIKGEIAIAVVDDALLSLSANYKENYDILDTFYRLGDLGVRNFQTLTQLIGRRTFGKKGANPGGGGGGTEIRSDFKNTALWIPHAETDDDGKYHFKFKVPDNLTTWKVIAISVDDNHRFGFGETEFLASKPLMIEPALPNFLIAGDIFNTKILLSNRTGSDQNVQINANASNLELKEKEKSVTLKNNANSSILIPSKTKDSGTTNLTVKAKAGQFDDAFSVQIPVLRNSITKVISNSGTMKTEKENFSLKIDPNAYPDTIGFTANYSNTILNGIDEVFRYVLHYPYGCWEQRLTAAYFLAQYEQFKKNMIYRFPETEGSIKKSIQDLLNKASEYQVNDGGMRYYPGGEDQSVEHLSIFTGHAYAILKKFGYKTDAKSEKKLISYLKNLLKDDNNWNQNYFSSTKLDNKAFIIDVLDRLGEKNLTAHASKLFSSKDSFDLFGLAYLTGYMGRNKNLEKEANALKEKLLSYKVIDNDRFSFSEPNKFDLNAAKYWDYTKNRDQCVVLQNLVSISNKKEDVVGLARYVMENLEGGRWYNTQENIHCFEGLRKYVEKFELTKINYELIAKVDEKNVDEKISKNENMHILTLGPKEITVNSKNVSLENKNKAELYFSNVLRFEVPFEKREKIDQGFSLEKKIYKLNKNEGNITWTELNDSTIRLKRGDILKIKINSQSKSKRYQVMLNDPLAACFEPINTKLATTSIGAELLTSSESDKNENYRWDTAYYRGDFEYMDLRLQAAQFYAKTLNQGSHKVEYLVQTIATGEFTMPEATIEEMYYPNIRGTEISRKFIVEE